VLPNGTERSKNESRRKISLAELESSHQALEDQIAEAMLHKAVDDLEIVHFKRRRLHVKEEIERLRRKVGAG
jgi:hypothetical protein